MKTHHRLSSILLLTSTALLAVPHQARADYQSVVMSQSPAGYWRLNDNVAAPSPVTAANLGSIGSSGNGSFLADVGLGGSGALPAEPASTAAVFPGYMDRTRVSIANNNASWSPSGSFSVEFWAKPNRNTGSLTCPAAYTHFLTTPLTRRGWLFYQGNVAGTSAHGWSFRVYTNGSTSASLVNAGVDMTIDTNSWYHVVGVYNASGPSLSLYVNGALATTVPMAGVYAPVLTNTITMTWGCRSDNAFAWAGKLDEPAFYPVALTATQIAAHYSSGTNAAPSTPYATTVLADAPSGYWRLNESYGPPAANIGTSATAGVYSGNSVPGSSGPASPTFTGFEAVNKAVTISSSTPGSVRCAPLNLNANNVTMTAWVKPNGPQTAYSGIVFQWANSPALTYSGLMVGKDGGMQLGYTWANTASTYDFPSTVTLTDGQWQFIAVAVSPTSATLCADDGSTFQTAVNTTTHAVQGFQGVTHIGMDPFTPTVFNGDIDEVAVFNRTLNVGEIYSLYAAGKGELPPQIFQDPVGPVAIFTSETLTLSVIAGGTPALTYQWRKNSSDISGATNSTFVKANVTSADDGTYDVVVKNSFGSVTSASVAITVQPQDYPSITSQPVGASVYQNGYVNLKVEAAGGNLRFTWYKNGSPVPGATNASYLMSPAQGTNSGNYYVTVRNTMGSINSDTVTVAVTVPAVGSYESKIVADNPISWWRLDEGSGYTFADSMGRNPGAWVTSPTLGVPGALAGNTNGAAQFALADAAYGSVPFAAALNSDTLTVECWVKTSEVENNIIPVSSWAASPHHQGYMFVKSGSSWRSAFSFGDTYVYTYVTIGTVTPGQWTHLVYTCSPSAGWSVYLNGVRTAGPYSPSGWVQNTSEPFRIGVDVPGAGSYNNFFDGVIDEVAVYGTVLAATNILAHYEAGRFGTGSAPSFTVQPASQSVTEGLTATFSPTVIGSSPISYQWAKGGTPIPGATNLTLSLPSITFATAGNYTLTASNAIGSTTSLAATLTVVGQPTYANLTNSLVMHLKFDGNYNDSTGRGNNGINNGTSLAAGKIGSGALSYATTLSPFAATYVDLGVRPDLQFGTNTDFSVAFWFKFTGTPNDLPFFCNSDTSSGSQGYTIASGYGSGGIDWSLNSYRYSGSQQVNDGNWHNIVLSIARNGNAVTYIDGTAVDTRLGTSANLDTGFNTVIGQGCFFDYPEAGAFQMDDVGVWRRALAANEAYNLWYVGENYGRSYDTYGPVLLELRRNASGIQLIWQAGTLQQADTLAGPWTPVSGASAPTYQVGTSSDAKFYRVKL